MWDLSHVNSEDFDINGMKDHTECHLECYCGVCILGINLATPNPPEIIFGVTLFCVGTVSLE